MFKKIVGIYLGFLSLRIDCPSIWKLNDEVVWTGVGVVALLPDFFDLFVDELDALDDVNAKERSDTAGKFY